MEVKFPGKRHSHREEPIMLVLSRRDGEQIVVGDNVIIKVLAVAHGRVRVGIEAPRNVQVRRSEIPARKTFLSAPCLATETISIAELAGSVH
jgi:carbon storage regulator